MKRALVILAVTAGLAAPSALAASSAARHASYTIIHVRKGCHAWLSGSRLSPSAKLTLKHGGKISFLNRDTDGHKLVELSGPAKLHLAKLGRNGHATVKFTKRGTYKLGTKIFEVAGAPDVKTVGRDNVLRLTVVVK